MVSAPRFSVLLPTHARPDSLGFAIQSVLGQTETDFELLVVGDGVADETRAVLARFSDPRIRFFDLPKGPGFGYANRNVALREARGSLVAPASDDNLFLPDHLARLGRAFDDPAVQMAYSQALWVSADGIAAPDLTDLRAPDQLSAFRRGNTVVANCVVYRVAAFEKRDVWPEWAPRAGDWELWKQLINRHGAGALAHLPYPTMLHFTAPRYGKRDAGFHRLGAYLEIADQVDWWPPLLRPAVETGSIPQAVYARLIQMVPDAAEQLRAGCSQLVARVALDRVDGGHVGQTDEVARLKVALREGRAQLQRTRHNLEQLRHGLFTARAEMAAIDAIKGWHGFALLRRIRRRLARKP